MGLFDRLFKRQERSESGSPIYRYGEERQREWGPPTAECDYKLKHGGDALLDLFDKHNHPHVADFRRPSYV